MAKRYKLVPENLAKRLLMQDEMSTYDEKKPDAILRSNMPDDLKILLHADAARDVQVKKQRARSTPLLVKNTDAQQTIKVDRIPQLLNSQKALEMHNFLKNHGISYNDEQQVVVNGQPVPNSFYPMLIRGLQNKAVGFQPGMTEVLNVLPANPPGMSKAVLRSHQVMTPSAATASTSTRSRRVIVSRKGIKFPQRGTGWTCLN